MLALPHPRPHERHAHARHDRAHIGEVEVDEPRHENQVRDALHRLEQHRIRHLEGVEQRRAPIHHGEQALVRDRDQRVHDLPQLGHARLGLLGALAPLEHEGLGDDGDGEDAEALGHLGHDRSGAGAGPAPESGRDEDHVGPLEDLLEPVPVLQGRVPADLGVGSRPEPPREPCAQLELDGGRRSPQSLEVGVGHDELDAGELGVDHPVDRV